MNDKEKEEWNEIRMKTINITKLHELYKLFHIIEMNPFTKYDENIQNQNSVHYTKDQGYMNRPKI